METKEQEVIVRGMKTINITNKDLINRLNPAFSELAMLKSNADSGKLKYSIKRTINSIEDAVKRYAKQRNEIFEDRCKVDEEGNPMFDDKKNYLFEKPELKKEALKKLEELDNEEIKLTIYPVSLENIINATKQDLSIAMEYNLGEFIEYAEGSEDAKFFEEIKAEKVKTKK